MTYDAYDTTLIFSYDGNEDPRGESSAYSILDCLHSIAVGIAIINGLLPFSMKSVTGNAWNGHYCLTKIFCFGIRISVAY